MADAQFTVSAPRAVIERACPVEARPTKTSRKRTYTSRIMVRCETLHLRSAVRTSPQLAAALSSALARGLSISTTAAKAARVQGPQGIVLGPVGGV